MNNRKYLLILGLISTTYSPTAKADLIQCIACPAGTYGINGECKNCAEGYYSDTMASTSCKKCNAGTYSNEGKSCEPCPIGYKCPDGKKIQCEAGTVSITTKNTSCSLCPEGSYAIADRTYCGNKWSIYKEYKTAGTYTETLPAGMYKIEISGAGASGGNTAYFYSSDLWKNNGDGGHGCNGELKTYYLQHTTSSTYTIKVGAGGQYKSAGNDSYIQNTLNIYKALGGEYTNNHAYVSGCCSSKNGKSCYCNYTRCGASGGDIKKGKNKEVLSGNPGGDGWVVIYKADDSCYNQPNGTGCISSSGGCGGGCS
ncbi:MAG: hypothetical protein ACI4N3_02665 [Alphaproteobacteria bacterium]